MIINIMNLTGSKAKGVKFENGTNGIRYWQAMNQFVGIEGTVIFHWKHRVVLDFGGDEFWCYPIQCLNFNQNQK